MKRFFILSLLNTSLSMKRLSFWIILILSFTTCKKEPSALLAGRWDFIAMDMPDLERFLNAIGEESDSSSITSKNFFG